MPFTEFPTSTNSCVLTRLTNEIRNAFEEFRRSPGSFLTCLISPISGGTQRINLLSFGFTIGLVVYSLLFLAVLLIRSHQSAALLNEGPSIIVRALVAPKFDLPEDDKDPGGGGGGGKKTNTPPSAGELAPPSINPIVAPTPQEPLKPPTLPVIETLLLDPRIQIRRDDSIPTGLPDGVISPPSAGPGEDGGIGTGKDGGIGSGDGPGFGPGRGGYTGGGIDPHPGGIRNRPESQAPVDSRPVLLNEPRPFYTEEARRNKVQGVVKVRLLINEKGSVAEVILTRGLPDGLSEQAIRAAYQMKFRPAIRQGVPVAYWLRNVEIEFNLR